MRRLLEHPLLSAALFAAWIGLNGWSAAQAVLGLALALLLPPLVAPLGSAGIGPSRLVPALRLLVRLLGDIVYANINVARLVLGPTDVLTPAIVRVPLDVRSDQAVTLLARIVTITPGTATIAVIGNGKALLVHVLHTDDPDGIVATIKTRYERLLLEIFEC